MVTQRLLWMKNLPRLDSDYRLYCIYLFIENGFDYFLFFFFFTTRYFNALQCYSELTMTTCYRLTMALSFFDSGK